MSLPLIISSDALKEHFPQYSPKKASQFHEESAKLADKFFENAVKIIPTKVVLLAGGSASGKTEYLSGYLEKFGNGGGIFFDGTLPSFEGAKIKIQNIQKQHRDFEIHFVLPKNFKNAFIAFLNRERHFSPNHFYRTHSTSRETILQIAQEFPEVCIRVIESRISEGQKYMIFEENTFENRQGLIDFLSKIQYTEEEIVRQFA